MRLEQTEDSNMDYRGIPTVLCPCGSNFLNLQCVVDPETYEISFYNLDATCVACGALLTVAVPPDLVYN